MATLKPGLVVDLSLTQKELFILAEGMLFALRHSCEPRGPEEAAAKHEVDALIAKLITHPEYPCGSEA